ncbi:hypothetical protein [Marinilabilia salmonicolor]|uniref:DUF1574 domain-containing protein n=1 Tax=Marinilabilia salmonicolor TaxID=989 RepID=A0A368UJ67_9BACT|nr:hypothetical protein [Marinilabilia salmonicolor]RCW27023.1 hypothetical protein DFO77_1386 [Marinilabilia salmonicolor]
MKKFLKSSFIYFVIALSTAGLLEYKLRQLPNPYKDKAQFLSNNKDIEVLILGSSHTYRGLNPEFFNIETYNVAFPSQLLEHDAFILKKYINDAKKLKYVILPISYFTLFKDMEDGIESWREKYYYLYFGYPKLVNIKNALEILSPSSKPLLNKFKVISGLEPPSKVGHLQNGFGSFPDNLKTESFDITGRKAAIRHTPKDFKKFPQKKNQLEKLIEITTEKNIQLFLLTTPKMKQYRKHLSSEVLNKIDSLCLGFAIENENTHYINLRESNLFDDNDFYDSDHLNPEGAKKLSFYLSGKLDSIALSAYQNRTSISQTPYFKNN